METLQSQIRAIRARVRKKATVAAIIAVLAAPALYLIGLGALFAEWLAMGWRFLADSTLVPNWVLALLAICAFIVAGMLGAALRPTKAADSETREPPD